MIVLSFVLLAACAIVCCHSRLQCFHLGGHPSASILRVCEIVPRIHIFNFYHWHLLNINNLILQLSTEHLLRTLLWWLRSISLLLLLRSQILPLLRHPLSFFKTASAGPAPSNPSLIDGMTSIVSAGKYFMKINRLVSLLTFIIKLYRRF